MTKTANKRRPKGEVLQALDALIVAGKALRERVIRDDLGLAKAAIERLTWRLDALDLLPLMSRGIQTAADFNRAGQPADMPAGDSLAGELIFFRRVMDGQLAVLSKSVERWRQSGTRPLT